jgi:hypothetical protein
MVILDYLAMISFFSIDKTEIVHHQFKIREEFATVVSDAYRNTGVVVCGANFIGRAEY